MGRWMMVRFTAFGNDPVTVARSLLGQQLVRVVGRQRLAGIIVEVEAYLGAGDRAAHTYNGRRTPRNESMYLGGGHAYVYFTYGMHYCMNVVCGRRNDGTAVLLRAIEPTEGLDVMFTRRAAAKKPRDLCSGPGKLTQAFGIDRTQDGLDLRVSGELFIEQRTERGRGSVAISRTPRIGVGYAGVWAKRPLRFLIRGNTHVSRR